MADISQSSHILQKYRYSIQDLLQLSQKPCLSFDLSKFSYDAARAGVIPPLSECAMSSRRSSAQRTRGWSEQTTSTFETKPSYPEVQALQPVRDPAVPPPGLRAQEDQGFARFLKKHSSPTHNRVTAGGRIVPMEPRPTPPLFAPGLNNSNKTFSKQKHEAEHCVDDFAPNTDVTEKPNYVPGHGGRVQQPPPKPKDAKDATSTVTAHNTHISQQHTATYATSTYLATPAVEVHAYGVNGFDTSDVPIQSHLASCMNPIVVPQSIMGHDNLNLTYNCASLGFLPPAASYGSQMLSMWSQHQLCAQELLNQQVLSAQNSFKYWSQCYEELDRQLKTLDRQRAMSNLNQAMVSQRREIVQQRSDTKDIIDKLQAFLGLSEQAFCTSSSVLNINAPTYIPASQQLQNAASSLAQDGIQPVVQNANHEKPQPPGKKRPIPIVQPPKLNTNINPSTDQKTSSDTQHAVDEWGVKLGTAPPELERQQSEMLESLVESVGSSSQSIVSEKRTQISCHKSFSENDAQLGRDDESSDNDSSVPAKAGRAPPHIEVAYELQLDALRQPQGIVSQLKLPDGTTMFVEGQDLKQPPVVSMSEFEKNYWSKKPVTGSQQSVTPSISDSCQYKQELTIAHPSDDEVLAECPEHFGKENITVAPLVRRKAATDAFLMHFDRHNGNDLPSPSDETQSLRDLGLAQNDRNRQILQDIYGDVDCASKTISEVPQRHERAHEQTNDHLYGECLSNKGYTSTSTQNIHAVVHPPSTFDGTTDAKRGTKLLLGITKKAVGPRLVRRSGTTGSSWFGPFRRDFASRSPDKPLASPTKRLHE